MVIVSGLVTGDDHVTEVDSSPTSAYCLMSPGQVMSTACMNLIAERQFEKSLILYMLMSVAAEAQKF